MALDKDVLVATGLLIGGIITVLKVAGKLPWTRNSSKAAPSAPSMAMSEETGGAKHISEEALGKLTALQGKIEDDYTPTEHQADKCRANHAELTTKFVTAVGESEKRILQAIKDNGK